MRRTESIRCPNNDESRQGRVTGYIYDGCTVANNVAWAGMTVEGATVTGGTGSNVNGADISAAQAKEQATYTGLGWSFGANDENPWKMGVGDYPLPVFYWQTTAPPANLGYLN